jgi:OOP family OmpA-OmpF porin
MNGKITFAPGSAEIDPGANATIDALAAALILCPDLSLEISAHSDAQGSEGGNKALSQARAEAVLLSLQGRRAPVGLLRAVGYGEERPIADNGTEAGREANRRIEFTLIGGAPAAEDRASPAEGRDVSAEPVAEGGAAAPDAGLADDGSPSVAPAENTVRPKPRAAGP